jgi:ferrous iron transport protein B
LDRREILDAKDRSLSHLRTIYGDDAEFVIADGRYGFISGLLKETLKRPPVESVTFTDRVDRVLLNRVIGIPIFLLVLLGIFEITFTLSGPLMGWIGGGFDWLGDRALEISPDWLASLLGEGVVAGVGAVLSFVPPIFLLFICLTLLEDCGYMARAAFVIDRVMHRVGLHGRSFIPMILGFGCSVPGIMATRTIENNRDRITTILITPLMSCGARLPIYTLLAAAFFTAHQGLIVFSFYLVGAALALIVALILRKTVLAGPSAHFVMELPPYRRPTIKGVMIHTWERGKEFLMRAGTIIFVAVVFIWFMASMPWGVEYGSADSWIGQVGEFISPIFAPCGFDQWQASVGLVFGVLAKEAVVGTFGTLFGEGTLGDVMAAELGWTPLIAYAFMAFVLIYVPCVATIGIIKRETKTWRWPAFAIVYTTVLAWVVATLIFQIGSFFVDSG